MDIRHRLHRIIGEDWTGNKLGSIQELFLYKGDGRGEDLYAQGRNLPGGFKVKTN